MKYWFIFLTILVLSPFLIPAADSGEAFLEASKRLPVTERIERAREAIRNSDDNAVVAEAVWDLAKFAVTPERARNALIDVEALIAESERNTEVSHRANSCLTAGDVLSVRDNGLMKDNLRQIAILNKGTGEISLHKLAAVPPNGKLPVINHYPVPKKRSPNPNDPDDYYFPIGWSMFLHDYQQNVPGPNMEYPKGEGDDLAYIDKDWEDGTLDKLKVAGSPWNTVFGVSRKGYTGDADTEPDSDQFVGCLEAASSTPYPVKVLPQLLNKRFRNGQEGSTAWSLPAAIGWTTYPGDGYSNSDSVLRNYDDELEDMIDDVSASQDALAGLGGWVLVDEPYSGDVARTTAENPTEVSYDGDGNPDMWYWSHGGTTYNLVTDVTPYAYQQAQDNTNMVRDDLSLVSG